MLKPLKLSIVIPALNEEAGLKNCLNSIAEQTKKPFEVIVVDNGSIDKTAEVAASYSFVKLLHEPVPGLIAARNRGFVAARGDILARINADVILASDWVERATRQISKHRLAGITGLARAVALDQWLFPKTTFWSQIYFWGAEAVHGVPLLWGANMAIRRNIWQKIKAKTTLDDWLVHEDLDLSYLIAEAGGRVMRDRRLLVATNEMSYHDWPKFSEYVARAVNTKLKHQKLYSALPRSCRLGWPRRVAGLVTIIPPGFVFTFTSCLFYAARQAKAFIASTVRI